jgi:hypothetical protein
VTEEVREMHDTIIAMILRVLGGKSIDELRAIYMYALHLHL